MQLIPVSLKVMLISIVSLILNHTIYHDMLSKQTGGESVNIQKPTVRKACTCCKRQGRSIQIQSNRCYIRAYSLQVFLFRNVFVREMSVEGRNVNVLLYLFHHKQNENNLYQNLISGSVLKVVFYSTHTICQISSSIKLKRRNNYILYYPVTL